MPREWLTSVLICDDCGREYPEDRDECPDCSCLDAELVDTGGGPGRFWGYRGLRPLLAVRQLTPAVGIAAGRMLCRWYRAKRLITQVTVQRVDQATGRVYYRNCRKRKQLFRHNRGFLTVNDGPAFAYQLAPYLAGLESRPATGQLPAHRLDEGLPGTDRQVADQQADRSRCTGVRRLA